MAHLDAESRCHAFSDVASSHRSQRFGGDDTVRVEKFSGGTGGRVFNRVEPAFIVSARDRPAHTPRPPGFPTLTSSTSSLLRSGVGSPVTARMMSTGSVNSRMLSTPSRFPQYAQQGRSIRSVSALGFQTPHYSRIKPEIPC